MEKKFSPVKQRDKASDPTSTGTPKDVNRFVLTSLHIHSDIRDLTNSEETQMNQHRPTNQPAPGRLLRLDAVENMTGLRKSSIYTYMASKSHGFPTPVRIGARAVAWRESDIWKWIAARTEARPQGGGK